VPNKRTFAASIVVVWLSLDLAAEVARLIACQVGTPKSVATVCSAPAGSASLVWDKLFRLHEAMDPPAPPVIEPPPPAPPPAPAETPLEKLRQQPKL
jgi:hypothetical protein